MSRRREGGRPCSVCQRPDRTELEAALRRGVSLRTLAGEHDLSKDALGRHRTRHMPAAVVDQEAAAAEAVVDPAPDQSPTRPRRLRIRPERDPMAELETFLGVPLEQVRWRPVGPDGTVGGKSWGWP